MFVECGEQSKKRHLGVTIWNTERQQSAMHKTKQTNTTDDFLFPPLMNSKACVTDDPFLKQQIFETTEWFVHLPLFCCGIPSKSRAVLLGHSGIRASDSAVPSWSVAKTKGIKG